MPGDFFMFDHHVSGLAYVLNCSKYLVLLTRVCGNCWVGTISFRYYYISETTLYVLCFLFFGQVRCQLDLCLMYVHYVCGDNGSSAR